MRPPGSEVSYRLLGNSTRTGDYSCDFGAYMHDLGREIGCNPTLGRWLWESPRVALAYSLGQAYVTFFRLEGPFKQSSARQISETELLAPVWARPWATNLVFALIVGLFGVLNAFCWVADRALQLLGVRLPCSRAPPRKTTTM